MKKLKKKPSAKLQTPQDGPSKTEETAQNGQLFTSNRWTFLTNHAHVLGVIHAHPDMVLRQIALRVGITERAVQRIVQDLEEGGYLVRERVGRRNRYQVKTDLPLRHPIEAHRNIGDLLQLVAR